MTARAQEIVIEIAGMAGAADERAVVVALLAVRGVSAATASRAEGLATVTADPTVATDEALAAAVTKAGFAAAEVRFPE